MKRQDLLKLLNHYQNRYQEESSCIEQFIEFVMQNSDCFERSLSVGHVTGSAWVINPQGTSVLLTHHRKLDMWLQLGGHADGNPDILAVAMRETMEESGFSQIAPVSDDIFDIDIHLIPARHNDPAHYHYDVRFAIQVTGSDRYTVSEESHDLSWVNIKKMSDFTQDASILRMADKWLSGQYQHQG